MSTRNRHGSGTSLVRRWRAIGPSLAAAAMLASLAACSSATTSPSGSGPAGSVAAPVATPAPATTSAAHADTLRIGVDVGLYRSWQPATEENGVPALTFGRLVYSGVYRYDGRDNAVPDLADGPCFVPGADGKVIRCRLKETTFQDGTPLAADDVAYTYQIFQRPNMYYGGSQVPTLKEVRAVDQRTVDFVLSSVDATFLTSALPMIPIFSRHSIEAAVAAFDAATNDLTADGLATLADDIDAEINRDPPVCSDARIAQVEAIYRRLGYPTVYHEDVLKENGEFDACLALYYGAGNLSTFTDSGGSIGYALGQTGIDRVAGIVGQMVWGRPDIFVGTGPYRYVSQDADSVHLEAWPGYHGGMAATKYVDFVRAKGDGSDLDAGTVDILPGANLGAAYQAAAPRHGVRVVTPPTGGYFVLTFNVRPGRLFADVALRRALQLCIDLKRDVDAATGGAGTPIYGPVLPGSWGDDPDLPRTTRDTAAVKRLIEAAGWQLGADGIYAKDGVRLAAEILVRGNKADRVKMADLIGSEARDCGMDVQSQALGDDPYWAVFDYPHDIPATKTPFDLLLSGWTGGVDPDMASIYASSAITDAAHPASANLGGFSDPAFDRLLAAGKATYDQVERTRIYRQAQEELAAQLPAIFLWATNSYDALRSAVTTVDGPLDLAVPNWAWQPERMVVAAP